MRTQSTTRERILDAALDMFVERGVAATTVSDIERAVGLAAGTGSFYRHFRSKEDVLVVSVERGVKRLAEKINAERATLAAVDDPVERRARDYEVLLSEMRRFEPLWRLIVAERDRFPELQQIFTNALDAAHWDFGWNGDTTHAIAVAALAGYHQFVLLDAAPYRDIAPPDFVAALVELTTQHETARARGR